MQVGHTVQKIPVEIWSHILALLRDETPCEHRVIPAFDGPCPVDAAGSSVCPNSSKGRRLHYPLLRACRFLWNIGESSLYREITWLRGAQQEGKTRKIARHSKLQNHVQLLYIREEPTNPPILHDPLPPLANLRDLVLSHITITGHLAQGLLAARRLRSLDICFPDYDSPFGDDVADNWSGGQFGPELTTLKLSCAPADTASTSKWLQLFVPSVRRLELPGDVYPAKSFTDAAHCGTMSLANLRTLVLRHGDPDDNDNDAQSIKQVLPALIALCTQLENLWLDACEHFTCIPHPATSKLRYVGGHLNCRVLKHALSLPSVECLQIVWCGSDFMGVTAAGRTEPSGVKCLVAERVKWKENVIDRIVEVAPKLEKLLLHSDDESIGEWMPGWFSALRDGRLESQMKKLPHLRELYLVSPAIRALRLYPALKSIVPPVEKGLIMSSLSDELKEEREVLKRIRSQHCKELELVRFAPGYAWIYHRLEKEWYPCSRPVVTTTSPAVKRPLLTEDWSP